MDKRVWVIVIGLVIVVGLVVFNFGGNVGLSPKNSGKFLFGDANSDGSVDINDIVLILEHTKNNKVKLNTGAGDVNGDGVVDGVDARDLLVELYG